MKFAMVAMLLVGTLMRASPLVAQPKLDNLLVYGDGFIFSVKEPPGWHGDTENASQFAANVMFYRKGETPQNAGALLRVRLNSKTDENIAADLQADMDGYRRKFAKVRFRDIKVAHPRYRVVGKVFFVPGDFYEYVVYINPGLGKPWVFAASMNKQRVKATPEEINAFRAMVRSVILM